MRKKKEEPKQLIDAYIQGGLDYQSLPVDRRVFYLSFAHWFKENSSKKSRYIEGVLNAAKKEKK